MEALNDEVESLEAILMEDVKIIRNKLTDVPEIIETTVLPILDDENSAQQYVCVTLQVLPPPGYPDIRPAFKLLRPRGLDDACLLAIETACKAKLDESVGFPVVFDLIDVVREHLTVSNVPSGQCVVCLYGFSDGDEFTRTECFHYLHSYCLARHLNASRRNHQEEYDKLPAWQQKTADPFRPTCPVCREHIADDAENLKCAMPPAELQNAPDFQLTKELRELQRRMSQLFMQQKERGAIIDVAAEGGTVISIETEEEVRRRQHRKQQQQQQQHNNTNGAHNDTASALFGVGEEHKGDVDAANGAAASKTGSWLASEAAKGSAAPATNFVPPSVTATSASQRCEPTNNNYHHNHHYNRRHHRGGRRHHHRDRNGERTASPPAPAAGAAAVPSGSQTAAAATNNGSGGGGGGNHHHHHQHHNHHGKQSKSHSHGSAHSR